VIGRGNDLARNDKLRRGAGRRVQQQLGCHIQGERDWNIVCDWEAYVESEQFNVVVCHQENDMRVQITVYQPVRMQELMYLRKLEQNLHELLCRQFLTPEL
jgi:hypothetical protein